MNNIVVAIIAIFASAGFWQFITVVWQNKHKKNDITNIALKVLLHDRLYQACTHYIKSNVIDIDGLENVTNIYNVYHALGGNGTGTELYNRCVKLPIKENTHEEIVK